MFPMALLRTSRQRVKEKKSINKFPLASLLFFLLVLSEWGGVGSDQLHAFASLDGNFSLMTVERVTTDIRVLPVLI